MSFEVYQAQGLRIFRGDTATVSAYTGNEGELSINTETKAVYVHDGLTPGGTPLATAEAVELAGITMGQLANVYLDDPQNGQVMVFDESDQKWKNQLVQGATGEGFSGAAELDDLNDVKLSTAPSDGEVLAYDGSQSQWINTQVSGIPVGMIAPFAMVTPPTGWLVCDGSLLDSVTDVLFANLYAAIGTSWGGDSASNFYIPDLRGEFLRGLDYGKGVDSGRAIGTSQGHGIPQMVGSVVSYYNSMYSSSGIFKMVAGDNRYGSLGGSGGKGFEFHSTDVIPDAPEVRPRNQSVQFCIKY